MTAILNPAEASVLRFATRDEHLKFYDINGVEMTLEEVKAAQAAAMEMRRNIEDQQLDDNLKKDY